MIDYPKCLQSLPTRPDIWRLGIVTIFEWIHASTELELQKMRELAKV